MRFRTLGLAAAALAALGACALPDAIDRREQLVRDLADDAVAFNEAYAQAMTSQILVNILRARDRQPTQYLAMSAIQDSPQVTTGRTVTLGSLNFGDVGSPWAVGEIELDRSIQRQPSYSVGPFAADDIRKIVFDSTDPAVFAEYWNAGWPKDLLLLVMADRIARIGPGRRPAIDEFVNDAGDFRDDCNESVETRGCDYVRLVRALAAELRNRDPDRTTDMRGVCGLAAAYAPARAQPAPRGTQTCDRSARIVVGDVQYAVVLRSLDDMVYYLGELLRGESASGAFEAPIRLGAAGLPGGGQGVPLFRVTTTAGQRSYAASVSYGGARYFAGPAISRDCAEITLTGPCRDDAESGDRSSQVLALLMQLLLRNQSDQSRPPPPSIFIRQ